jgi:hypothetical protein
MASALVHLQVAGRELGPSAALQCSSWCTWRRQTGAPYSAAHMNVDKGLHVCLLHLWPLQESRPMKCCCKPVQRDASECSMHTHSPADQLHLAYAHLNQVPWQQ